MARKITPTNRDKGTVSGAKYLFKVKGYPVGLTAKAGGGQTGATLVDGDLNYVTVCATGNDSLLLPQTEIGRVITVLQNGAQTAKIYGNPADTTSGTIDGTSGATGKTLAAGTATIFYCPADGVWVTK